MHSMHRDCVNDPITARYKCIEDSICLHDVKQKIKEASYPSREECIKDIGRSFEIMAEVSSRVSCALLRILSI